MLLTFNKSTIGYSHVERGKVCQDYSSLYKDNERTIITCCDGHGGDLYIRSNIGSKLASLATINVFNEIKRSQLFKLEDANFEKSIKLSILCEWNRLVESWNSLHHISKSEIINLSENKANILKKTPIKAYGTTLTGAMQLNNKLVVVGIGDSEILGIKNGKIIKPFDNEDEPAGNITYSLCQEDAFNYLKVKVIDFSKLDGIILCTDGLSGAYQTYDNFNNSFIKPMVIKLLEEKNYVFVDNFIDNLAKKLGTGDDVSLAFIIKDNINKKYYV